MTTASRPFTAAGAALLGAGFIASAGVAGQAAPAIPELRAADVALQASVLDIFTFPAWQQSIANEIEFVAIRVAGLTAGGAGLAESLVQLPGTLLTATQQVFSGNALDALTTVEEWALASAEAIFVPPIASNIEIGQIQLAIQSALLPAQPIALVEVGSGLFTAFDLTSRALIIATQNLVSALASFNIGDIVSAVVTGISDVLGSFVAGGQAVVDGIVAAQTTLADALAARPTPPVQALAAVPAAAAAVAAPAAERERTAPPVAEVEAPRAAGAETSPATSGARARSAAGESTGAAETRTGADIGEARSDNGRAPAQQSGKAAAERRASR